MSDFKHQNPNADHEEHVEDDSKTRRSAKTRFKENRIFASEEAPNVKLKFGHYFNGWFKKCRLVQRFANFYSRIILVLSSAFTHTIHTNEEGKKLVFSSSPNFPQVKSA